MIQNVGYFPSVGSFIHAMQGRQDQFILLVPEAEEIDLRAFKGVANHFYGCIFPEVIFDSKHYKKGIVAISFADETKLTLVKDMATPEFHCSSANTESVLVFFDGLSQNIDMFMEELFVCSDANVSIMGGGAGKLSLKQEAVIFDKEQFYTNGAVVVALQSKIGLGVQHGWKKLVGEFLVTEADGNKIKQINYENALKFYEKHLPIDTQLTAQNFFSIAMSYPFGLEKLSQERVVRDPLFFDDEGIVVAASIAENSVVTILQGDKQSLVDAAAEAAQEAIYRVRHIPKNLLVVDCISRAMFLEEDFSQELEAIKTLAPESNMFGVLSIGEVANNSYRYIEVFNKTCVIGAIES